MGASLPVWHSRAGHCLPSCPTSHLPRAAGLWLCYIYWCTGNIQEEWLRTLQTFDLVALQACCCCLFKFETSDIEHDCLVGSHNRAAKMAEAGLQELLQQLQAALAADAGALKYLDSLHGPGIATALMQV